MRKGKIPDAYKMISSDVKILFSNVALDKTIRNVLKKVYKEKKIEISIAKSILKELLYLCAKQVHVVAMGCPLGLLLANVEEEVLPTLWSFVYVIRKGMWMILTRILFWKKYSLY